MRKRFRFGEPYWGSDKPEGGGEKLSYRKGWGDSGKSRIWIISQYLRGKRRYDTHYGGKSGIFVFSAASKILLRVSFIMQKGIDMDKIESISDTAVASGSFKASSQI